MSSNRSNDRGISGRIRVYPSGATPTRTQRAPLVVRPRQEEGRSGSARADIGVITIPATAKLVLAGVVRQAN